MRPFGFKERLAAGYAAMMAGTFALVGCVTYGVVASTLDDQLRQTMIGMAVFQRSWPASYPPFAFTTTKTGPGMFYLAADGHVLYRSVTVPPPIGQGSPLLKQLSAQNTRVFADVETPEGPRRALAVWADPPYDQARIIEVTLPLGPMYDVLHRTVVWILGLSAIATLLSVPLGVLLARRALQPLAQVIDTARAMDEIFKL